MYDIPKSTTHVSKGGLQLNPGTSHHTLQGAVKQEGTAFHMFNVCVENCRLQEVMNEEVEG